MDHFNQPHAPMPGGTDNLSIAVYGVISQPVFAEPVGVLPNSNHWKSDDLNPRAVSTGKDSKSARNRALLIILTVVLLQAAFAVWMLVSL